MKVLVATASKHGATTGLGEAVGAALAETGLDVTVLAADEVGSVAAYDAVVIGSGIYAGRWLEPAKRLIAREEATLRAKPVWLFSSGPMGNPPVPAGDPADAETMIELSGARGHRTFAGMLDRKGLGFAEKAIVAMVKAPDGDFRPWDDVRAWAGEIAVELVRVGEPVG
jgi:menaquinone-dependent protoporphyrinogen oxidase